MPRTFKKQELYRSSRPFQTIRKLEKTSGGYHLVKANPGLHFNDTEIKWDDGSRAVFDGDFYVLNCSGRNMNGNWQRHGRKYETPRQVYNLLISGKLCVVVDKSLAEELNQLFSDYEQDNNFRGWHEFCRRNQGLDTNNWLNFINFVTFVKKRKWQKMQ